MFVSIFKVITHSQEIRSMLTKNDTNQIDRRQAMENEVTEINEFTVSQLNSTNNSKNFSENVSCIFYSLFFIFFIMNFHKFFNDLANN
jgi:hypothetical protein